MNVLLQEKCDLLVQNRKKLMEAFKWGNGFMNLSSAGLFTGSGMLADTEQLKSCEQILKSATGAFSEFRGNVKSPLICKMLLNGNAKGYFDRVSSVYNVLNKHKWLGNEYKIIAAMTICDHEKEGSAEIYIERINDIYDRMKKEHRWLTSTEDIPLAALLAVSEYDVNRIIEETEKVFSLLKKKFGGGNALQSLSHVMAMDERPAEEKCARVSRIFDLLKEKKHKYGMGFELAILGILAMLEMPEEEIVDLVIEADDYLKTQKGFGAVSMGARHRRMFAAWMVSNTFVPENKSGGDIVLNSMLAYSIAMEVMMIIVISNSCIAASNAAASS